MVTSGLFSGLDVSPVRLAIHLGVALIILALGLWVALGAFAWPKNKGALGAPRWAPFVLLALLFVQVMLGAFLAGSRGGAAYADWPWIGGEWIPSTAFGLEPFWVNFTEDHATQHLLHRTGGYVVALTALALALMALIRGQGAARWAGLAVGGVALAQAGLGVLTVVSASPLSLSLAHQAGAVALWIATIAAARGGWR
jgi:cytochrome c oxidase assembly protein subunit 15